MVHIDKYIFETNFKTNFTLKHCSCIQIGCNRAFGTLCLPNILADLPDRENPQKLLKLKFRKKSHLFLTAAGMKIYEILMEWK